MLDSLFVAEYAQEGCVVKGTTRATISCPSFRENEKLKGLSGVKATAFNKKSE